ncbi:hypothetical protein O9G_002469 [Rozella allomycis CSF55]|uniref:Uncharacterized protein n=1 Tax=Rozella allomycis (strain CSF55) TaxID=988480 RepID=A0A075AUC4_ROZAC|nr:hypothetical protein O9G_002469 [Rozella allomycis CSF55]|eukprot:EPZ33906.1 hypothetical protein O9G_002469 [Rozella allomycis CSF55]
MITFNSLSPSLKVIGTLNVHLSPTGCYIQDSENEFNSTKMVDLSQYLFIDLDRSGLFQLHHSLTDSKLFSILQQEYNITEFLSKGIRVFGSLLNHLEPFEVLDPKVDEKKRYLDKLSKKLDTTLKNLSEQDLILSKLDCFNEDIGHFQSVLERHQETFASIVRLNDLESTDDLLIEQLKVAGDSIKYFQAKFNK